LIDMKYDIIGKTLKTQAFKIDFGEDIKNVIVHNNIFIVLLNPINNKGGIRHDVKNNVYGVSSVGEVIWQIQNPGALYPNLPWGADDTFVGIACRANGILTAVTFGYVYALDCKTGKVEYLDMHW